MFKLKIDTNNKDFGEDCVIRNLELVRILEQVIIELKQYNKEKGTCFDINNHNIGNWKITNR